MFRLPPVLALSLWGLGACGTAPESRAVAPPVAPLPHTPSATLEATAPASSAPAPAAELSLPEVASVEPPAAPPQPPQVLLEAPYSALGHERLGTEMATLERDDQLFQWALGGSSDPAHPRNRPGYHPATRVVVDVTLLSRAPKGSTKRLERIARSSGYWPLRACFEQAQRQATKLDRSARVRLTLSESGKLLGSRLIGTAPERDYARCVQERLRRLDFSPGFTRKLDVEISVKQWPGHAPVPPRAPDGAPRFRASPELRAALEAKSPELVACYEGALARDPKLWGRLALRLELDAEATVKAASEVETRLPDPELVECARQTLIGARLASSELKQLTLAIRFGQGVTAPPVLAPPSVPGAPPLEAPAAESDPSPPAPAPALPAPPAPPAPPLPEH